MVPYVAILVRGEGTTWRAYLPDFIGCRAEGESAKAALDQAKTLARESINGSNSNLVASKRLSGTRALGRSAHRQATLAVCNIVAMTPRLAVIVLMVGIYAALGAIVLMAGLPIWHAALLIAAMLALTFVFWTRR